MPARLIDTNVLVYANNIDSPFHVKCRTVIEKAISGEIRTAVSLQNLIELYAVITDKRRVEHPLPPVKAKELVEFYKSQGNITIITPTVKTLDTLTELVVRHIPKAQSIFDCLLVATMLDNGVHEIYTANVEHFKSFPSIKAINPI